MNDSESIALSTVLPVLNQGVRIIPVITTLAVTIDVSYELIIVYDDAEDPTLPAVERLRLLFPNIRTIQNTGRGVIGAIRTGFDNARAPVIGVWQAYHVDPFGLINDMYRLCDDGCALVSGNRFDRVGRISRGGLTKKLLSRGGNFLFNRLTGIPLGDVTTSIKLYRREFLDSVTIETTQAGGWALSTELAVKAAVEGLRIGEVRFRAQNINLIAGISSFRVFRQLDQYLRWLIYAIKHRSTISQRQAKLHPST